MEHWFDRLAQPHTRRATIKAGILAGAALVLPVGRLSSASAAQPCIKACRQEATIQWNLAITACANSAVNGLARSFADVFGGVFHGLEHWREASCRADAVVEWKRAVTECLQPECGDRAKYPGGNAPGVVGQPPTKCDPTQEIQCGDICCNATGHPECCFCTKTGMFTCCASGSNCTCCGR